VNSNPLQPRRAVMTFATMLVLLHAAGCGTAEHKGAPPSTNPSVVDLSGARARGALLTFERGTPSEEFLAQAERAKKQPLQGKVTIPAGHQVALILMNPDDGPPGTPP
jgi:hypothetical protein